MSDVDVQAWRAGLGQMWTWLALADPEMEWLEA